MINEILQSLLISLGIFGALFVFLALWMLFDIRRHPEEYAPPTYKPMFADEWEEMAFYDDVLADGLPFFGDR